MMMDPNPAPTDGSKSWIIEQQREIISCAEKISKRLRILMISLLAFFDF